MIDENERYAYFSVVGDFDPRDLTARLGIPPSECWNRGDVCPRTHRERTFSRWCLHSRLGRSQALEDHIRDVLAQLEANPQGFGEVSREFGGFMQLVAYFHRDYPGLHFERDITEGLARYALAVDFDFYWLHPAHREDT